MNSEKQEIMIKSKKNEGSVFVAKLSEKFLYVDEKPYDDDLSDTMLSFMKSTLQNDKDKTEKEERTTEPLKDDEQKEKDNDNRMSMEDVGQRKETDLNFIRSDSSVNSDFFQKTYTDHYRSCFSDWKSSKEMNFNFSDYNKFITWRKLWIILAKVQNNLEVISVTDDMISEMEMNILKFDPEGFSDENMNIKRDSLTHKKMFQKLCPKAAEIIGLNSTPYYVEDNGFLISIKNAFHILIPKLVKCVDSLAKFADKYKDVPTVGYTHLQPTRLTTVGRRVCMWIEDLLMDLRNMRRCLDEMKFLGDKGFLGNQYEALDMFFNNNRKVRELDAELTESAGFSNLVSICGQTYSRKEDIQIMACLAGFGASIHKICTDIKILDKINEFEEFSVDKEQFEINKRCNECCASSMYLINSINVPLQMAATQTLECAPSDYYSRQISSQQAFLFADSILSVFEKIIDNLAVRYKLVDRRVKEEIQFIQADYIANEMLKLGVPRNQCYEKLRKLEIEESDSVRVTCKVHLAEKMKNDLFFAPISDHIDELLNPRKHIGRAINQVKEFLRDDVKKVLNGYL